MGLQVGRAQVPHDGEESPPSLSESIRVYPSLSESIRDYPSLSESIRVYPNLSESIRAYPSLSESQGQSGSRPRPPESHAAAGPAPLGPARLRPGFTIDSLPRRLGPLLAAGLSGQRVGPTDNWWPSTHTCWLASPAVRRASPAAGLDAESTGPFPHTVRVGGSGGARSAGPSQARRSMSAMSGRTWPGGLPYRNVTWSGLRGLP